MHTSSGACIDGLETDASCVAFATQKIAGSVDRAKCLQLVPGRASRVPAKRESSARPGGPRRWPAALSGPVRPDGYASPGREPKAQRLFLRVFHHRVGAACTL